jgi:hypothetical protein
MNSDEIGAVRKPEWMAELREAAKEEGTYENFGKTDVYIESLANVLAAYDDSRAECEGVRVSWGASAAVNTQLRADNAALREALKPMVRKGLAQKEWNDNHGFVNSSGVNIYFTKAELEAAHDLGGDEG